MAERELTDSEPAVTVETQRQIDALCDEFEQAFRDGENPRIEDYPRRLPDTCRPRVLRELVAIEVQLLAEKGSPTNVDDYRRRFPDAAIVLEKGGLTTKSQLAEAVQEDSRPDSSQPPPAREHLESPIPHKIGRYELGGLLGQGGFGSVYVAHDRELDRHVAIKVQRPSSYTPDELEAFRKEARILADLDHAHIVPVFDTGQLDDGRRYIVSKWINGTNLAEKLAQQRMPFDESARLLAVVADALHYAHRKKLVHRDVKPANILVDSEGNPFVADFGLVLTDQDFGDEDMPQGGTAAYMSPEQARIEGHRIDGRSDIFSLGVVMYEMLTGEQPFKGNTVTQLLDHIKMVEVRPPRMLDDHIPKELERICLRALSKLATDRYDTAMDMADDLRHFELDEQADNVKLAATRSTCRTDDDGKRVASPTRIVLNSVAI